MSDDDIDMSGVRFSGPPPGRNYKALPWDPDVATRWSLLPDNSVRVHNPTPAQQEQHRRAQVWRVGRKLERTVYRGETFVGIMDTPELAQQVVEAVNAALTEQGVI